MSWLIRKCHRQSAVFDHRSHILVEGVLPISVEMIGQLIQTPVANATQTLDEILDSLKWGFLGKITNIVRQF